MRDSTPSPGDSISTLVLSVSTSAITSPRLTRSPSFFNHRLSFACVIDSPSCGSLTSIDMGGPRLEMVHHAQPRGSIDNRIRVDAVNAVEIWNVTGLTEPV